MALVACHWGDAEHVQENRVTNTALRLAVVMGLVATAGIFSLSGPFTTLPGRPPGVSATVIRYLRIDTFGHFFLAMILTDATALRATADMKTPIFVMGILNVLGSTTLVYGPGPVPAFGTRRHRGGDGRHAGQRRAVDSYSNVSRHQ